MVSFLPPTPLVLFTPFILPLTRSPPPHLPHQLAEAAECLEQCLGDLASGSPPRPDADALARHKSAAWDEAVTLLGLLRALVTAVFGTAVSEQGGGGVDGGGLKNINGYETKRETLMPCS